MSIETADVLVYVDSDGKIVFSVPGNLNLGGDNITNVTELTEVTDITNTTTNITITPDEAFEAKIGTAVSAVRDFWASNLIEAAANIKNAALEIIEDHPVIEGLINEAMNFKPISSTYDVVVGSAGAVLSNFFGWADVESDTSLKTDSLDVESVGAGIESMISRIGTGGITVEPSASGYPLKVGTPSITSDMYGYDAVEAATDVNAGDDLQTDGGEVRSLTEDLTLYADEDTYDLFGGTPTFIIDLNVSNAVHAGQDVSVDVGNDVDVGNASFHSTSSQAFLDADAYKEMSVRSGTDSNCWLVSGSTTIKLPYSDHIVINKNIKPNYSNTWECGESSEPWSFVYSWRLYAEDGTVHDFSTHDDIALIKNIRGDPKNPGFLDPETFPDEIRDKVTVIDPDTKEEETWYNPFIQAGGISSLLLGGFKQFHSDYEEKISELYEVIGVLQGRIEILEAN